MNRLQLVQAISAQTGLTEEDALKAVNAFTDIVSDEMKNDGKVVLLNFGVFDTRQQSGRGKMDFKTGQQLDAPRKRVAYFKNAPELKQKINS
jgi:DNA-binding protein HU-beta